ncbi:MAG: tRNA (adenosine(37)-N6)-threonylcarbamoyltransferase complex ATPase subunit type 1 TsaE [Clostridia bacterium]|nr:tRNA (adenosine(37)-N6)-threonylcarbamoyltransferase complex ATPase subunit type 1 TsaE [Clostridia bacterium]
MAVYKTDSVNSTAVIGERLGAVLKEGDIVAMFGDLGAGKTSFVRGVVQGIGINPDIVSSPTFSLVNEYRGEKTLYHFDMYRINGWDDLYSTGYFDYIDTQSILIIEWSENIESVLPENCIRVSIEKTENENERIINIGRGESFEDIGC